MHTQSCHFWLNLWTNPLLCLHIFLGKKDGHYITTVGVKSPTLTHWGRVTHICVSKLAIIGSDNGLSPGRRQAIIWSKAGILLIGLFGTNIIEILIGIQKVSFKKMHLKMLSAKSRPFCFGLNVLTHCSLVMPGDDLDLGAIWQQVITLTSVDVSLIRPSGIPFQDIVVKFQTFSFRKIHFQMSPAKCHHFALASMC